MRAKGNRAGYIVVQPSAPDDAEYVPATQAPSGTPSWVPVLHHAVLIRLLRDIVTLFDADRRKVHVTGFSQGGFASWNILCNAPDLICSAAPLEASGLDQWGDEAGYGTTCFTENGPEIRRSIFFTQGTTDPLSNIDLARAQVSNVKRAYGMMTSSATIRRGTGYTESTWTAGDVNFEYFEHQYNGSPRSYYGIGGHCFQTPACRCSKRHCSGHDWSHK